MGAYTKILKVIKKKKKMSAGNNMINLMFYVDLPNLTTTIAGRRVKFNGHY